MKIGELTATLAQRLTEATLSRNRIGNRPLADYLRARFERPVGSDGSFLADPVFEGAFPWISARESLAELCARGELSTDLVAALAQHEPIASDERADRNTWPQDRAPYAHQLEAWRQLARTPARSVVVASGTGSGKTEAFLVPILNDLVTQTADTASLTGVQAILLYPLNALIASQRDRLSDWTEPFSGQVRFCLYNGHTPEQVRQADRRPTPWEVRDRTTLRKSPPPLLVTNATMLEYMLVRTADAPILAASRGKLRWIVLDEAHTYVGSQAAELTLLLRRTIDAFGVKPQDVRFVAASATLGEGEQTEQALRRFLADVAGIDETQVDVIVGRRDLRSTMEGIANPTLSHLQRELVEGPRQLSELVTSFKGETEALIEQAIALRDGSGKPFLPLRVHLFQRAHGSIWACVNSACRGRHGTALESTDWPYGKVFERDVPKCDSCGSTTFEVRQCGDCGTAVLDCNVDGHDTKLVRDLREEGFDEFLADADEPDIDDDGDEPMPTGQRVLLGPASWSGGRPTHVHLETGEIRDIPEAGTTLLRRFDPSLCPHCGAGSARRELFQSFRLGGPFMFGTAANVLLDSVPARSAATPDLPFGGRQLITFTDSRQGTARFAAKWQQDSERNFARSNIFHCLLSATGASDEIRRLEQDLEKLRPATQAAPQIASMVAEKEQMLALLRSSGHPLPWEEVRRQLGAANGERRDLLNLWQERDPQFGNAERLATLQLYTEFLRRPVRANSLETMGFVAIQFDAVERLQDADIPVPFARHGGTLSDWKDYLYLTLTHYVRENSFVHVGDDLKAWVGQRVYPRSVQGPGDGNAAMPGARTWLQVRRTGGRYARPILWLRDGLGFDPDLASDRDDINEILQSAHNRLWPLRMTAADHFRLDLEKSSFVAPRVVWRCPTTQRFLTHTFRGLTPFLSVVPRPDFGRATKVDMPRLPWASGRDERGTSVAEQLNDWLRTDSVVTELRLRGWWTDLHDRIAQRAVFARIVEHSAQQPPSRLREFERLFKAGRINVLNCSTTMEMGVDIGGITTVGMTNVPPSAANYRQRVGRAGRRGEAVAVAYTYCPDTPLGWTVFTRPKWPLTAVITAPRVALNSESIVQRHLNSYLLARFLRENSPTSATGLKTGWFFGLVGQDIAPVDRFREWLSHTANHDQPIRSGLAFVTARSVLQGRTGLVDDCRELISEVAQDWRRRRNAIVEDLAGMEGAAKSALELQQRRFEGEFLLGELAARGFLPGYGFPTDVVPFVVVSLNNIGGDLDVRANRAMDYGRVDPTRQLDVAVREYAPGSSVVLNGVVYRSAGITLNWQRPATDAAAREVQSITRFWRCRVCSAAGESHSDPEICATCGGTEIQVQEVLRPAGFAVDIGDQPNNDVDRVTYVPGQRPLITAAGAQWLALDEPELGRFRTSANGLIMAYNLGAFGKGYAVCLGCGRAEPESADRRIGGPMPEGLSGHRPLRRSSRRGLRCTGNDEAFKVKRHLALGYTRRSDVFELQLVGLPSAVARTVAVALREALARRLGIERDELGCDVASGRDHQGMAVPTISLFDQAAGGAGYASQAASDLPALVRVALEVLDCPSGCDSACPACLIVRDTVGYVHELDRKAARIELARVSEALHPPAANLVFGSQIKERLLRAPIDQEIDRRMEARRSATLALYLGGSTAEWDLSQWWGAALAERWARSGRQVVVALDGQALHNPTFGTALAIRTLADRLGANGRVVRTAQRWAPGSLVASVAYDDTTDSFAIARPGTTATERPSMVVVASEPRLTLPTWEGEDFDAEPYLSAHFGGGTHRITIASQLDGPIGEFGQRFWQLLGGQAPDVSDQVRQNRIVHIAYSDRYLFSPLPLRLFVEVLRALPGRTTDELLPVEIHTMAMRSRSVGNANASLIHHDWQNQATRDAVMLGTLRALRLDPAVRYADRSDVDHTRLLRIEHTAGSVEIILDQGFGFWRTKSNVAFDFSLAPTRQIRATMEARGLAEGSGGRSTVAFVTPIQLPQRQP